MSLRFLHTSDWHLGRSFQRIGPESARSRKWRFDAVRRVYELAVRESAQFLLVAGDVFQSEAPQANVVAEAVGLLRDAPAPIVLLPGNHDPNGEGSVWRNPEFVDALAHARNVILATSPTPIELADGRATIFPCPVTAKRTSLDLSAWIPQGKRERSFRIGLAHGVLQRYDGREYFENFLAADRADQSNLDYFALGDLHSYTPADHPAASKRTYYSGTLECTAVDEKRPGYALVVEIPSPGADPVVRAERVGKLRPVFLGAREIGAGDNLEDLKAQIQSIENPREVLLGLALEGAVAQHELMEIEQWSQTLFDRFLAVEFNRERLFLAPTEADFQELQLDDVEKRIVQQLRSPDVEAVLGNDDETLRALGRDPDVRREAIALLYRKLREES